jgi:hypothetical protein
MTSTSTHPNSSMNQTVSGGARSAGSQAMRAAGRQLLATAGNQVLKAAVDRAVGEVDHVAGRLDAVASGQMSPRPRANRKPSPRPTEQREHQSTNPVKVKVGAAFSLIMQQALRLLQLIQRLAQQLLATLSRLLRRGEEAAPAPELTDSDDSGGVDRMAPRSQGDKTEHPDASAGQARPAAGQPARAPRSPQAPRRQGPRPAAREATGAPRRVAGDRPARVARND